MEWNGAFTSFWNVTDKEQLIQKQSADERILKIIFTHVLSLLLNVWLQKTIKLSTYCVCTAESLWIHPVLFYRETQKQEYSLKRAAPHVENLQP